MPAKDPIEEKQYRMAEAVRQACLQAALKAYEEAGISGLCSEGRWEMAIDSIRSLDLTIILHKAGERASR